jgi:DNA modification methylase
MEAQCQPLCHGLTDFRSCSMAHLLFYVPCSVAKKDSVEHRSASAPPVHKPRKPFDLGAWVNKHRALQVQYRTEHGAAIVGKSEDVLSGGRGRDLRGKVQLVFTSPPFPLNRKKRYENQDPRKFKAWLAKYAVTLRDLLTPDGSIVVEMGNAWMSGKPVMSTLALESLLAFKKAAKLYLIQEFIWYNPAKLPTPAQWVNVKRVRVKDAFTRLWWLSPTEHPKADNRRVLVPYSESMKTLLAKQTYNSGKRPSQHVIGAESFLTDNGGAIPPNVLTMENDEADCVSNLLIGANTGSTDSYHQFCKTRKLDPHPARMPSGLAKFFINFCTEAGDLVCDPFAGSNTTGAAAEELGRHWITIEAEASYAATGIGRFSALAEQLPPAIEKEPIAAQAGAEETVM